MVCTHLLVIKGSQAKRLGVKAETYRAIGMVLTWSDSPLTAVKTTLVWNEKRRPH